MQFELNKAISILERTPAILTAYLGELSPDWTHQNEGSETWSAYDIIGHLIHGETTDWIPRTKVILSNNTDKRFVEFDRFAQFKNSKGKSLQQLLSEFTELRKENIRQLKSFDISSKQLELEGIHPEFGKVSLQQLLSTWTVHDLGHIAQISRIMAKQYKKATGPWLKYLTILN